VLGHTVRILDPYRLVTDTPDKLNVLASVDPQSEHCLDDCRDIAKAIIVRTAHEHQPHFPDMAEFVVGGMTAATVAFGDQGNKSLQSVRELLTDPQKMAMAIELMRTSDNTMLRRVGNQMTQPQAEELGSILSTANRNMNFLDTPAIYDSTVTSTFDPNELLTGKSTIYIVLPPDRMRSQSGLLRLWIAALLRVSIRGGLHQQYKVHYVLDEAASLGRLEPLDDAVDKLRGYNVRLQLYYQSLGQLRVCWPDGRDQTLLANTSQV
jgi:type IV secretion system protein VirD4